MTRMSYRQFVAGAMLALTSFGLPLAAEEAGFLAGSHVELVQERYPNRQVKLEREVTLDANNNYVNHGSWTRYDQHQNILSKGVYKYGKRDGVWEQRHTGPAAGRLTAGIKGFAEPILSIAEFDMDVLNGVWVALDGEQRKVFEISFVDGRRHGVATWYHPGGKKLWEMTYINGMLEGELLEINAEGKVVRRSVYQNGRRLAPKTEYYPKKRQKKSEGMYLFPQTVVKTPDDWSQGRLAVYTSAGDPIRHGSHVTWYENGQINSQAEYVNGAQVGHFLFWHSNGQKAVEGFYENGRRIGQWTWYHINGLKSAIGEYENGAPVGDWLWWREDGQLVKEHDFSGQALANLPDHAPAAEQAEESLPTLR